MEPANQPEPEEPEPQNTRPGLHPGLPASRDLYFTLGVQGSSANNSSEAAKTLWDNICPRISKKEFDREFRSPFNEGSVHG